MAADQGTLAVIRDALVDSERVDAQRIELTADGEDVVLVGAVASNEEATVAAMVAAQHTESVRNELVVDPGLREDATASDLTDGAPEQPGEQPVTDAHEALGENVPLDPPDEPNLAPTEAEQRD